MLWESQDLKSNVEARGKVSSHFCTILRVNCANNLIYHPVYCGLFCIQVHISLSSFRLHSENGIACIK